MSTAGRSKDVCIDEINRARQLAREALAALEAKKLKKALRLANEALALHPAEAAPHQIKIEALVRQGNHAEAEAAARDALAIPLLGFDPAIILALGRLLLEREDGEGAFTILRRADHLPSSPGLMWALARAAALARKPSRDVLLRMEHAVRADSSVRPRDIFEEPAFEHYWRTFIPTSTWIWQRDGAAGADDTTKLVGELVELASKCAPSKDLESMYRLLEAAKKLDLAATRTRVRSDPALRVHWRDLRMRILIPRSALDALRFWD